MSKKIIRTKFNVTSITEFGNGGGRNITLQPVVSGSEENKSFWDFTPSGKIEMHITNPDAEISLGEYYVDFIKAE